MCGSSGQGCLLAEETYGSTVNFKSQLKAPCQPQHLSSPEVTELFFEGKSGLDVPYIFFSSTELKLFFCHNQKCSWFYIDTRQHYNKMKRGCHAKSLGALKRLISCWVCIQSSYRHFFNVLFYNDTLYFETNCSRTFMWSRVIVFQMTEKWQVLLSFFKSFTEGAAHRGSSKDIVISWRCNCCSE